MNKESLDFDLVYWKPKAKVGMILLYNARRTRKKKQENGLSHVQSGHLSLSVDLQTLKHAVLNEREMTAVSLLNSLTTDLPTPTILTSAFRIWFEKIVLRSLSALIIVGFTSGHL